MALEKRPYDPKRDKEWSSRVYQKAKEVVEEVLSITDKAMQFSALCTAMKQKYPALCDETLMERQLPNSPYWKHMVASAIQTLKQQKKVKITTDGWIWLGQKGIAVSNGELEGVLDEPEKLVEEIGIISRKLAELVKRKEESPRPSHDELVQKVKEIGEILGKSVDVEWGPLYKCDCVWKDNPYATPRLAIEVCDKGNLDKDIASLHWAAQTWAAKGILVAFEEADFQAAKRKLTHESQIHPLRANDMIVIHTLLNEGNTEATRCIFGV